MTVGVRIVDDPAPSGDGMPVMDVPVFVGFAAKGPLHRPVALDSAAAYAAVFGGGLDLVQAGDDPSERLAAHLPPAVEAFFAGGGRRCHVIRVAGSGAAARFSVAGLKLATHAGARPCTAKTACCAATCCAFAGPRCLACRAGSACRPTLSWTMPSSPTVGSGPRASPSRWTR